ncbi:reticulon-4 receptor-like 2 isoform X2 [Periplaneta americana]|uniref:reticulon-4 receptor-like 2 isoform X2 n=1 Tax=Periplaneta americana TaxID=6978 RepID=UPI0037E9C7E9
MVSTSNNIYNVTRSQRIYYSVLVVILLQIKESTAPCPKNCDCFTWMPYVSCYYAHLNHLPKGIDSSVEELVIGFDNITTISKDEFKSAGLLHLKIFAMQSTHLTSFEDGAFSGAENLTSIQITQNLLRTLKNDVFCGLNSLQMLNLSFNLISNIEPDAFCALPNLQLLNLDNNNIRSLQNGIFKGLDKLTTLSLRMNNIEMLEGAKVFEGLHNVKFLDLAHNNITTLDVGNLMQGMTKLFTVYLIGNNLTCDCAQKDSWLWFTAHNVHTVAACASPPELSGESWFTLRHIKCSDMKTANVSSIFLYVVEAILIVGIVLVVVIFVCYLTRTRKELTTPIYDNSIPMDVISVDNTVLDTSNDESHLAGH